MVSLRKTPSVDWNPPWNTNHTILRNILAGLYSTREDSYRIVTQAGLPRTHIAFNDKAINNWQSILEFAAERKRITNVIKAALDDYPDNEMLQLAQAGGFSAVARPKIAATGTLAQAHLEKIIGSTSSLVPIHFLETGLQRARSVARIALPGGESGSGFLTKNDLLITNNHVLPDKATAKKSVAVDRPRLPRF